MAVIAVPKQVMFRNIEWSIDRPAQLNRSEWTKRRQIVFQPGPSLWTATADLYARIGVDEMLEVEAFLVDLEGQVNGFRLPAVKDQQFPSLIYPLVDGSGQYNRSLNLKNGLPGAVLKRGHKLTVNDQMVMVMSPVAFDGTGKATVTFKPSLRYSPPGDAPVGINKPTILVSLATSETGWSVDENQVHQSKQLALEEIV